MGTVFLQGFGVMEILIVQMALMREIVKQVVPKISSSVPMVSVYQQNGNAMAMKTVNMEKMRKTVSQLLLLAHQVNIYVPVEDVFQHL
eukprot:bmy_06621T0